MGRRRGPAATKGFTRGPPAIISPRGRDRLKTAREAGPWTPSYIPKSDASDGSFSSTPARPGSAGRPSGGSGGS
ncbi:MAG: hypothetical protein MZV64_34025 [Ignavibacteriales bacterium]|nr:hypothetical protein [Ignavibacteriales bacterium]